MDSVRWRVGRHDSRKSRIDRRPRFSSAGWGALCTPAGGFCVISVGAAGWAAGDGGSFCNTSRWVLSNLDGRRRVAVFPIPRRLDDGLGGQGTEGARGLSASVASGSLVLTSVFVISPGSSLRSRCRQKRNDESSDPIKTNDDLFSENRDQGQEG